MGAGEQIAQFDHLIAVHHTLGDGLQQLGLVVFGDAFPIVDNDGLGALQGAAVDLDALVGDVRIGDGDHHLAVFQPVAVIDRHGGGSSAADDIGAGHHRLGIIDRDDLEIAWREIPGEGLAVGGIGAVDIDPLDGPDGGDGLKRGARLLARTIDAEDRGVGPRHPVDRGAGGRAHAHARKLELMHQRQGLGGLDATENHQSPIERPRVFTTRCAFASGCAHQLDLGARAHAGDTRRRRGPGMDIGPVALVSLGMLGEVADPGPVDGDALGKILEGKAHGVDAFAHGEQALDIGAGDDQGHGMFPPL